MKDTKNIVFIIGDALRAGLLGCYGYNKQTSPTIDGLARNGVLFENAFSCANQTDCCITSMETGQYPIVHGILHHGRRTKKEEIDVLKKTGIKFLAEILHNYGYKTVGFDWLDRWHTRGYDYFGEDGLSPSVEYKIEKGIDELDIPDTIKRKIKILLNRAGFHLPGRCGMHYVNQALKFIQKMADEPFFLFIHSWDTHTPFDTLPEKYIHQFYDGTQTTKMNEMLNQIKHEEWRRIVREYHFPDVDYIDEIHPLYEASVRFFDDSIKKIVDCLQENNILSDTIIIITADHGENPLLDGVFVSHYGLYDPVIHVPLIIYSETSLPKKRVNGFIQHIDLFSTILDMIGIDYTKYQPDGRSLLPLINEEVEVIRDYVLVSDGASERRFGLRTKRYKYIYSFVDKPLIIPFDTIGNRYKEELYDLKEDKNEKINIIEERPDIAKEMKKKLVSIIDHLEEKKMKMIHNHMINKTKNKIENLRRIGILNNGG